MTLGYNAHAMKLPKRRFLFQVKANVMMHIPVFERFFLNMMQPLYFGYSSFLALNVNQEAKLWSGKVGCHDYAQGVNCLDTTILNKTSSLKNDSLTS